MSGSPFELSKSKSSDEVCENTGRALDSNLLGPLQSPALYANSRLQIQRPVIQNIVRQFVLDDKTITALLGPMTEFSKAQELADLCLAMLGNSMVLPDYQLNDMYQSWFRTGTYNLPLHMRSGYFEYAVTATVQFFLTDAGQPVRLMQYLAVDASCIETLRNIASNSLVRPHPEAINRRAFEATLDSLKTMSTQAIVRACIQQISIPVQSRYFVSLQALSSLSSLPNESLSGSKGSQGYLAIRDFQGLSILWSETANCESLADREEGLSYLVGKGIIRASATSCTRSENCRGCGSTLFAASTDTRRLINYFIFNHEEHASDFALEAVCGVHESNLSSADILSLKRGLEELRGEVLSANDAQLCATLINR